ncbi:MAG: metallophosphoesterase [Myxococcales bacterium]|nr:metallophosphoesterase [Myxococcales bacterium]
MSPYALRGSVVWMGLALACANAGPKVAEVEVEAPSGAAPWTSLDVHDDPGDFHFVLVTDRTGEHRDHVFRDAMPKVNLLDPAFVLSVGDLIEGYTDDEADLDAEWDEFEGFIEQLGMPFFYVPGNHDMSNRVMTEKWQERFGPSYYHFRYKDVLFVLLNSELFSMVSKPGHSVEGPDTQPEQMAFAERVLAENADARWTIVIVHQPFWDYEPVHPDWLRVESLLGDRPYTVFAGHIHAYTNEIRNDRSFVTLATTGGGSAMRGLVHGEFDHVALVSMSDDGPLIANLLVDGIHGENVRNKTVREAVRNLEQSVRVAPFVVDSTSFSVGTARIELHNSGSAAIEVEGHFEAGRDLTPGVAGARRRLAPGATQTLEIELATGAPVALERIAPAYARFTLSGTSSDGTPVEVERTATLFPERRFDCPPAAGPVAVDGRLDEWRGLPFEVSVPGQLDNPSAHSGPEDLSLRFATAHEGNDVYIAIEVVDDSAVFSEARTGREQDGVSFVFDARPDPERSTTIDFWSALSDGTLRNVVFTGAGPVTPKEDPVFSIFLPPLPEGVETASVRTETGYTVEIAIPGSYLDEKQGRAWDSFRFDLSVTDFDEGDAAHSTFWWRPSRFGEMAVDGSGTFVRR